MENNVVTDLKSCAYERLCDLFGTADVYWQCDINPCPLPYDLYVKSRNLFINMSIGCIHERQYLFSVGQEQAAKDGINYLAFWSSQGYDLDLWFACGCPDGCDWERDYSWLPRTVPKWGDDVKFTGSTRSFRMVARKYQFPVFYKRELDMWYGNAVYKEMMAFSYLFYNRWKYLGKLPHELSGLELMNGFTISGMLRGYTGFDALLMNQILEQYGIQSVYDPCAGWGERMLCCFWHGVSYLGVDVNEALAPGYEQMMSDLGIQEQSIQFADSACVPLSGKVDAVITCPPCGKSEIYSSEGAENMSEDSLLEWWQQVVENSLNLDPTYFCVQLNQKWCTKMIPIIESCGFSLAEKLDMRVKSSHMTRRGGKNLKKEYESMVVLRRIR